MVGLSADIGHVMDAYVKAGGKLSVEGKVSYSENSPLKDDTYLALGTGVRLEAGVNILDFLNAYTTIGKDWLLGSHSQNYVEAGLSNRKRTTTNGVGEIANHFELDFKYRGEENIYGDDRSKVAHTLLFTSGFSW